MDTVTRSKENSNHKLELCQHQDFIASSSALWKLWAVRFLQAVGLQFQVEKAREISLPWRNARKNGAKSRFHKFIWLFCLAWIALVERF